MPLPGATGLLGSPHSPIAFLHSSCTEVTVFCSGLAEDAQSSALAVLRKPAERLSGLQTFIQSRYPMDLEVSSADNSMLLQSMSLGDPFLGASTAFSQHHCQVTCFKNSLSEQQGSFGCCWLCVLFFFWLTLSLPKHASKCQLDIICNSN